MSEAYKSSGVDIHAGYESVERMKKHVSRTMRREVLGGLGGFGAAFDLSQLNMKAPVLVSGTDGVGTKLRLAIDADRHDTIGIDAVAMCVNDILTTGALPLYFLDYLALNKVEPAIVEQIVKGVAEGCVQSECALIGGETAEMGDMYHAGDYDIAGFAVGAVEKEDYITGDMIQPGNVIIGLKSSGIHSNGYSLVRKIIRDNNINLESKIGDKTVLDTVIEPTRLYVKAVKDIIKSKKAHGMCHITGGGFIENIPRVLPEGLSARIDVSAIPEQPVFKWLEEEGQLERLEMYNVFNMGVGFVIITDEKDQAAVLDLLKASGEEGIVMGIIEENAEPITITGI